MARRQHDTPRTAYGRRQKATADAHRGMAKMNLTVAGVSSAGAGVSFASGNIPLGAGLATLASVHTKQGFEHQAAGRAFGAQGRAVEDLVARSQKWDLRSNVERNNEPSRSYRSVAMVKGVSEVKPATKSMRPIGQAAQSVDALAYTAGTASTIAGAQMARTVRKGGAVDQTVGDAKSVASGAKARGARKVAPPQPSTVNRMMRTVAAANPFMMAAAGSVMASNAWNAARDAGGTKMQAAGAAGVAAAPMAVAAVAPTALGRYAPTLAHGLAKAALPLMALSTGIAAVRGGLNAYQQGESAAGVVKGAAIGAADSLTFGLASAIRDRITGRTPGPGKDAAAGQMQRDMSAAGHTGAYLNVKARAKAETASPPIRAPMAGGAAGPQSDGQTEGYQRTDPRTGTSVRVEGYKTPSRKAA